ncbi:MAG: hypothetical protein WKG07_32875 [Hymenobacter sp.]
MTFRLEGEANDYVGKGLIGARLAIFLPAGQHLHRPRTTSSSATWRSTGPPPGDAVRPRHGGRAASRCATPGPRPWWRA